VGRQTALLVDSRAHYLSGEERQTIRSHYCVEWSPGEWSSERQPIAGRIRFALVLTLLNRSKDGRRCRFACKAKGLRWKLLKAPGRPRTADEIERIQGAWFNLGHEIAPSTIAEILKRKGIEPAPGGVGRRVEGISEAALGTDCGSGNASRSDDQTVDAAVRAYP